LRQEVVCRVKTPFLRGRERKTFGGEVGLRGKKKTTLREGRVAGALPLLELQGTFQKKGVRESGGKTTIRPLSDATFKSVTQSQKKNLNDSGEDQKKVALYPGGSLAVPRGSRGLSERALLGGEGNLQDTQYSIGKGKKKTQKWKGAKNCGQGEGPNGTSIKGRSKRSQQ